MDWCCEYRGRGCRPTSTTTTVTTTTATATATSTTTRTVLNVMGVPVAVGINLKEAEFAVGADAQEALAEETLTCDLRCVGSAAVPVQLVGASSLCLVDVSIEQCREACAWTKDCEAILFTNRTQGAPYASMCCGKKKVDTSACQPGGNFITELMPTRAGPWGKCAIFSDPHILTWDRVYGPAIKQADPGEFYLVRSSQLEVHARFSYSDRSQSATATTGVAVGGARIGGHTLVVEWVGPMKGREGFKVFWDSEEILGSYPSKFESADGQLSAAFAATAPSAFHREAERLTGGVAGAKLPSYYFQFAADLNIYVLLGPDNINVVLESRKLPMKQDGYCGNFNCDILDDGVEQLLVRKVGGAISKNHSLFRFGKLVPDWALERIGPEDLLLPVGLASAEVLAHALPYTCHVSDVAVWMDEEYYWCCQHKGLGCTGVAPQLPAQPRNESNEMEFKKLFGQFPEVRGRGAGVARGGAGVAAPLLLAGLVVAAAAGLLAVGARSGRQRVDFETGLLPTRDLESTPLVE